MNERFEETLQNIEAFCRVLADKISGKCKSNQVPEPIENLLERKVKVEVCKEYSYFGEPLVDLFEDEEQIKILVLTQRLFADEVTFNMNISYTEVSVGECVKIKIPLYLDISKINIRHNGYALEVTMGKSLNSTL